MPEGTLSGSSHSCHSVLHSDVSLEVGPALHSSLVVTGYTMHVWSLRLIPFSASKPHAQGRASKSQSVYVGWETLVMPLGETGAQAEVQDSSRLCGKLYSSPIPARYKVLFPLTFSQ